MSPKMNPGCPMSGFSDMGSHKPLHASSAVSILNERKIPTSRRFSQSDPRQAPMGKGRVAQDSLLLAHNGR